MRIIFSTLDDAQFDHLIMNLPYVPNNFHPANLFSLLFRDPFSMDSYGCSLKLVHLPDTERTGWQTSASNRLAIASGSAI